MTRQQRDPEARLIYVLCIVITVPFIIAAFLHGATIGPGTTICIIIAALGCIGLVVDLRKRARLPRARVMSRGKGRGPVVAGSTEPDTVLIIEDEPVIQRLLRDTLHKQGFRTALAATLAEGRLALEHSPAVVLLDLGLPDGDGLELLREMQTSPSPPVIVLSARDREHDKIAAIDAGADDYISKPFDTRDLLARVQGALQRSRRPRAAAGTTLVAGPFQIDQVRGAVAVDGIDVALTPTELKLLVAFVRQPGKILSFRQLTEELWGPESGHQAHEIRIPIASLRRKIEKEPARPRWLVTEIGAGYRLCVDLSANML